MMVAHRCPFCHGPCTCTVRICCAHCSPDIHMMVALTLCREWDKAERFVTEADFKRAAATTTRLIARARRVGRS